MVRRPPLALRPRQDARHHLVPLLALAALALAQPASARWSADGTSVSSLSGPDSVSTIVSLGQGRSAVVWVQRAPGPHVCFRLLDVDGVPSVPEDSVCTTFSGQTAPVAIADGAGGLIVAWEDKRDGTASIYAQRINGLGQRQWTPAGVVVGNATGDQLGPGIVTDGSNGAILAWRDWRGGATAAIYAQRVVSAGTVAWTANGVAVSAGTAVPQFPHVAPDGAGGAYVSWIDTRQGAGSPRAFAQQVTSAGAVLLADVDVSPTIDAASDVIAWDGGTGAFVAFATPNDATFKCYVQHLATGGVPWAAAPVGVSTRANVVPVGLVASTSDTVDVVTKNPSGGDYYIGARRVVEGGALDAGVTNLDTLSSNPARVCVAAVGAGDACIVSDLSGSLSALRYADSRLGTGGAPSPQAVWSARPVIAQSAPVQHDPACVVDDRGELLVAWDDDRGGSVSPPNVYAQRFSPAGLAGAHRILVSAPGGNGTTTPAGSVYVADGANQDVTLQSSPNYHIASLTVGGVDLGPRPNYRFHTVTADSTLDATFSLSPVHQALATTAGAFSFVSLPFTTQSVAQFSTPLGAVDHSVWRLGRWDPANSRYDEAGGALDSVRAGHGYWLITKDAVALDVSRPLMAEQGYSIPLTYTTVGIAAWNQVGNPFRFAISDADLIVRSGVSSYAFLSGSNIFTSHEIKGWDPLAQAYVTTHRMEPGQAYWVQYVGGATVRLEFPFHAPDNGYTPVPAIPEGADWAITVSAGREGMATGRLVVGSAPVARGAWNALCGGRLPKPPMPACEVYVTHAAWGAASGDYAADFAAPEPVLAWDLNVAADGPLGPATLAFRFDGVPAAARVRLVDVAHGWARDVADGEHVEVALGSAPRTLRLEVSTDASVLPDVPAAGAVFRCAAPTPFADRTALVFSLPATAPFELDVFDVGGRRVHAVARTTLPAGEHVEAWDGRSDDGRQVPPGVYLARWRAGGTSGSARLVRIP